MTVKTTGAEFKRFYNDPKWWPDDKGATYHDDDVITVNGVVCVDDLSSVPDDALVTIQGGVVFSPNFKDGSEPSTETYFKRWFKEQATVTLIVECGTDKVDAIKAAIKAAGGRVN